MAGLIEIAVTAAGVVGGAVALDLIRDQAKASTPRLAEWLRQRAVSRLPEPLQERLAEEWAAVLEDTAGPLAKLWCALGFLISAFRVQPSLHFDVRARRVIGFILLGVLRGLIVAARFAANRAIAANEKKMRKTNKDNPIGLDEEIRRLKEIASSIPGVVGEPNVVVRGAGATRKVEVTAHRRFITGQGEITQGVCVTSYKKPRPKQS